FVDYVFRDCSWFSPRAPSGKRARTHNRQKRPMSSALTAPARSPQSQPAPQPIIRVLSSSWWGGQEGLMLLLVLAGLLILTPGGANPDLWGHVQYGKDVFAQGLPATTTYSYTAEGYRWINHENLTELLFAQIDMSWGGLGLQMLRLGLAALVVGILLLHFRRHRMDLVLIVAVTTLVLMNLRYHWSIRPQLFTYTFFLLMILLVDMALPGWAGVWNLPFARRLARA